MNHSLIASAIEGFEKGKDGPEFDLVVRHIAEHWLGFTSITTSLTNGKHIGYPRGKEGVNNARRFPMPRYCYWWRESQFWILLEEATGRGPGVELYFWNKIAERIIARDPNRKLSENPAYNTRVWDMPAVTVADALYAAAMTADMIQCGALPSARFVKRPT